jgi:hypothetical protein
MKTLKYILIAAVGGIAITALTAVSSNQASAQEYQYYTNGYDDDEYDDTNLNFQVFYRELSPYGRWIRTVEFGMVWIPRVGRDFHPYATNGYWTMTNYGNTWVSNYSWGWGPFHYGRWYYDNSYGWAWIPGYEWAPAWVVWRSGSGYYGWAPMGPRVNVSIHVDIPSVFWIFLPNRYMYHPSMHRYYKHYSPTIFHNTTYIHNTYIYNNNRYFFGPRAEDHYKATGKRVSVRTLQPSTKPGRSSVNSRSVSIYRPEAASRSSNSSRNSSNSTMNRSETNRNGNHVSTTRSVSADSPQNDRNANNSINTNSGRTETNTTVRSTTNTSLDNNKSQTRDMGIQNRRSDINNANRATTTRSTEKSSGSMNRSSSRSGSIQNSTGSSKSSRSTVQSQSQNKREKTGGNSTLRSSSRQSNSNRSSR